MKRWIFVLKLIPFLCLWASAPVFAHIRIHDPPVLLAAVPPFYALGFLLILCLILYSEIRLRSIGIIAFFIGLVSLFSHILQRYCSFPVNSVLFIMPAALLLFLGYLVAGRGVASGTNDGDNQENQFVSILNILISISFGAGLLTLMSVLFNGGNFLAFPVMVTAVSSILALRTIIRRNLDFDPHKMPFFYVFNKTVFRPVIYGLIVISSLLLISSVDLYGMELGITAPVIAVGVVVLVLVIFAIGYHRTKKRVSSLPKLPFLDSFLLFTLSAMAGAGILSFGVLSYHPDSFCEIPQYLLFLPSITGFLYFTFALFANNYKSFLITTLKLLIFIPPVLLIILNSIGVLPLNMEFTFDQCKSDMNSLGIALERYSKDNHGHYPEKLEQLCPKYIEKIPPYKPEPKFEQNPFTTRYYKAVWGLSHGSYRYSCTTGHNRYNIFCPGDKFIKRNCDIDLPRYNSEQGLPPPRTIID